MNTNDLQLFLKDTKKNSTSREKLLAHKVVYDLKLAAAQRGYDLRVYEPDVDRDGYDLILDDGDIIKKLQLKSIHKDSTKSSWEIRKHLLRPPHYLIEKLQLDCSPETQGVGGGFLLMEVSLEHENDVNLKYFYTDTFVVLMMREALLGRPKHSAKRTPQQFVNKLFSGSGDERISVPRTLLVQPRGHEELLTLMGMHSRRDGECWVHNLTKYLNEKESRRKGHSQYLTKTFSGLLA